MISYSKTTIALGLLTMLSTNPVAAADAISAARIENTDANDNLPKLNVSFPQYTYRYTTDDYQTFVQPAPVGSPKGETPTITTTKPQIATVNGNTITLTGETGIVGITYTYPATASHAETTAYYSVIVTAAEPTLVGTASDWNKVVNSGDNCANIKLTSDFTLGDDDKTFSTSNAFSGIIDGDGHTITLNFNKSNECAGLIACSNGAYIKNLRVAGKIINNYTYTTHIGGFIGYTESSNRGQNCVETVIENCVSSAELTSNSEISYVGGFIGTPQNAFTIRNCQFDGKITSANNYGRFVCSNWDINGTYYKSTISRCLSTGNIEGSGMYNSKGSTNEMVYATDNKTDDLSDGASVLSADNTEVLDGTFCYKTLNENNADGPWKQHIGYEKYPSLSSQYVVKVANNVYPNITVKANSLLTMALPVSIPAKNYQSENKVKIYNVDGAEDNVLQLVEFTEETIPAGLPVILYNTSSSDISFYARLLNTVYYNDEQTDKLLQTVYFSGNENNVFYAPAGSYVLQKKDNNVPAFYKVQNDNQIKIAQFKCYLKAPSANAAPCFYLPMYGTTGIGSVESNGSFEGDGKIYDLSGRHVNAMQKGQIYIIGGHKVMVK